MKNIPMLATLLCSLIVLAACADGVPSTTVTTDNANGTGNTVVVAENNNELIPFADVNIGIMDATDHYKLFKFMEGEGTCMEMGFPTNLVYAAPNMIKTEDEKYFEDMTSVDFSGRIRFNELPLSVGNVACEVKTTRGITTAQVTCSTGEGEEQVEVCTASFKLYAVK